MSIVNIARPVATAIAHALAAALCLLASPVTVASEQEIALGGMKVSVWSFASASAERQPVVLFSHGFHGCATQSRFLIEAFAKAGYIVFAPNHRDASCGGGSASWLDRPVAPFRAPDTWTDAAYRDRADDLRRLRDAIASDERFRARVDLTRLALVGHSLGGYTVLGMAGAWPGWKLDGVKAVLALSPYSQPFIVHHTLGGLSAPVMYQGGTRDFGTTPAIEKTSGAYEASPAPKYLVEFDGAGHFAWTNLGIADRQSIVGYSVAFLDQYVKGVSTVDALTRKNADVSVLRYDGAEVAAGDGTQSLQRR
jgi:alpha-beta hydrolase superfamily lysophospholipase